MFMETALCSNTCVNENLKFHMSTLFQLEVTMG
jgi:hypothetical protein